MPGFRTITTEELKRKKEEGRSFQLVNVLEPPYHHLGFIQGSKAIPLSELKDRIHELNKFQEVVVYCSGPTCEASREAAKMLAANDFTVSHYEGGLQEWSQAGLPMESSRAA